MAVPAAKASATKWYAVDAALWGHHGHHRGAPVLMFVFFFVQSIRIHTRCTAYWMVVQCWALYGACLNGNDASDTQGNPPFFCHAG
jgi:hypothetical protein